MLKINWKAKEQIRKKGFKKDQDFAESIDMTRTVLSGILNGRINPTPEEKEKINQGLGGRFV